MKKYFVIGNPISHSLSPKLHNFWFRKHNLNAKYEKLLLEKDNLNKIVQKVKTGEISGLNVTVPFKPVDNPFFRKIKSSSTKYTISQYSI
jgi:Shikimate 5-dehydrogenase